MNDFRKENTVLPALFIPAPGGRRAPCIIHFDGFDGLKEMLYLSIADEEFRRLGLALLIVDQPGMGEGLRLRNLYLDPYIEGAAGALVAEGAALHKG
jgi:hypothetical protein